MDDEGGWLSPRATLDQKRGLATRSLLAFQNYRCGEEGREALTLTLTLTSPDSS